MDPFHDEAARLIAEGADPRRAGPTAAEFFGLPRAVGTRQAFGVGLALGIAVMTAVTGAAAWILDLRPTKGTAVVVVPSTSDAAAHSRQAAIDAPTPVAQIEAALSPIPEAERAVVLTDLVRLTTILHDPATLMILRAIRDLSGQDRTTLAQDGRLQPVLAWMAQLTDGQQAALLAANLPPVLADPTRFALLQVLPTLDPLAARVLTHLKLMTYLQRQTLIATLAFIDRDDGRFHRLVAAFSYAAPSLVKLLDDRLIACTFANRGACR